MSVLLQTFGKLHSKLTVFLLQFLDLVLLMTNVVYRLLQHS